MSQEDTPSPPRGPSRARWPLPRLSRRTALELAGAALVGGTLGRLVSVFTYHPARFIYRGHLGAFDGIEALAWSPNNQRVASGAGGGNMQAWDALTGAHVQTFPSDWGIQAVAWSPNGRYLAAGDAVGVAVVWETATGEKLLTYRGHVDRTSPGGSGTRTVLGQPRVTPRARWSQDGGLNDLAWSPDGSRLLSTGPDFHIHVWEPLTGHTLWALDADLDYPGWSPDGRLIAGVAFNGVGFLDAATGQTADIPDITFDASKDLVVLNSLAWSPNGRYLAAPGYPIGGSYLVYVWEAATGRTVQVYRGHTGEARAVAWSPNSTYLASAGADMTVRV